MTLQGADRRDSGDSLRLAFSDDCLFRLVKQCTVYVQNVVDDALEGGVRVAGTTIRPDVRVRFTSGDFFERADVPWVGIGVALDIEVNTKVLGQKIKLKRNLGTRLEAPAYFDHGSDEEFHVNLDFNAVRVLDPEDESDAEGGKSSPRAQLRNAVDGVLRQALSVGVLQQLGKVSILTLSHGLLGPNTPRIFPREIDVDTENKRVLFGFHTNLGIDEPLSEHAVTGVEDREFVVIVKPEVLRALADSTLAHETMRWNLRGVLKKSGSIRLGIRNFNPRRGALEVDLSVIRETFPAARVDIDTLISTGELSELEFREFYISSHPVLELITKRVDDIPQLRAPLSMALRKAFLLEPILLPEERSLTVDLRHIHASDQAIAASGKIAIREGNPATFVQTG